MDQPGKVAIVLVIAIVIVIVIALALVIQYCCNLIGTVIVIKY